MSFILIGFIEILPTFVACRERRCKNMQRNSRIAARDMRRHERPGSHRGVVFLIAVLCPTSAAP
jgi:hypothetical protein